MAERELVDDLERALEADMKGETPIVELPPAVADLLGVAAELRQLPDAAFRARLRSDLLARAEGSQPPYVTGAVPGEIERALEEMTLRPQLVAYDLGAALRDLPDLAMRFLTPMSECAVGVSRSARGAHWERHPAADEMLYVLDGEMDVTTLTAAGTVVSNVRAGSLFICPRGLWHRIEPRSPVSLLFATPGEGTESSESEPASVSFPDGDPLLESHDVRAALASVRELKVGAATTEAEADAAFQQIATFNQSALFVGRFRGLTPWERHRGGDELLHVLDGDVEITVLTDDGPAHRHIAEGDMFICPQGLWHRQFARATVTGLYATPIPSDISWADDPRIGA